MLIVHVFSSVISMNSSIKENSRFNTLKVVHCIDTDADLIHLVGKVINKPKIKSRSQFRCQNSIRVHSVVPKFTLLGTLWAQQHHIAQMQKHM